MEEQLKTMTLEEAKKLVISYHNLVKNGHFGTRKVRVLYNDKYGGFRISNECKKYLEEKSDKFNNSSEIDWNSPEIRSDPHLIEVFLEKGREFCEGKYTCKLELFEQDIPNGMGWKINEYDGWESIEEIFEDLII